MGFERKSGDRSSVRHKVSWEAAPQNSNKGPGVPKRSQVVHSDRTRNIGDQESVKTLGVRKMVAPVRRVGDIYRRIKLFQGFFSGARFRPSTARDPFFWLGFK